MSTFPRLLAVLMLFASTVVLAQSAQPRLGSSVSGGLRLGAPSSAAPLAPAAAAPTEAAATPPVASGPREVDRVIAVVNADIITANELAIRRRTVESQLRRQRIELPPPDVLEKQVLERLILDRALVQSARDQGLRVDDAQLDRAMARLAEENRVTPAQMREQIERDGLGYARFREDIRDEILVSRLREREVDARVQISEADIDAYLAEQATVKTAPPEYEIAQILLRLPEGASAEQIERQRLRGEELQRQLGRGADFARLAATFSDASEALSGGSLGLRSADRLPQLFVQAVSSLSPGQTTQLIRSPNGFHLLKLLDLRSSGLRNLANTPVAQTRARHILVRPTDLLPEADAQRRLRQVRERITTGGADFADMARQYSTDGTASRGGDLGWVYPGDTVPEFERAMSALKPGEVSDLVRTEFGFHLIQVVERRTDTASPERVRAAARVALRERRIEESVQDWLRQVRDRTYVEYRER